MPQIVISGQIIDFPDSAASPNWAPAVIQFAQAVELALNGISGQFDIPPQVYAMVANLNTSVNLNALSFPTSEVRAATISYSVFRTTDDNTAYEGGTMIAVFNPDNNVGEKWDLINSHAGDGLITFYMTDTGQMQFTTETLAGANHVGRISFSAKALEQE